MATTVIKGGTVVTAGLSYAADVKLEGGVITEIGASLKGDTVLDATGCYVMPGGIDPHTHREMPFMGPYSADDFESGTRAALAGGTTMVVDFVLPGQGQGLGDDHVALRRWPVPQRGRRDQPRLGQGRNRCAVPRRSGNRRGGGVTARWRHAGHFPVSVRPLAGLGFGATEAPGELP